MKNKITLKKYLCLIIAITLGASLFLVGIKRSEYQRLTNNYQQKVEMLIELIKGNYPNVKETDIIEIFNQESTSEEYDKVLQEYFINNEDEIILENNKVKKEFTIINIAFYVIVVLLILLVVYIYWQKRNRELAKIVRYLERINHNDYSLNIDELSEDELSILKNELYKITVMLKESAANSQKDKMELKKSLEDISHQLKTPLTSILIMLDNLLLNESSKEVEEDFLRDIRREVININFLVQNLLKLSKFDVNAISFKKSKFNVSKLINACLLNVSTLCELKNIQIEVENKNDPEVNIDYHWNVEALTNILKNSIEYSYNDGKIIIAIDDNNAYTKISIKDFGQGISSEDLPHIFERFYKSASSSSESVGIGLSLAKTIIEKDQGQINVESDEKGTTFEIRYYKL